MKIIILAGGTGTRLWPLSRLKKPKQFQALTSQKTLLQETVSRFDFLKPDDLWIATNAEFTDFVKEQAPRIPHDHILIEPALRDTASCIGFAAAILAKTESQKTSKNDEVMAVIYADHLIQNIEEFQHKLKIAEQLAREENTLNIIEVKAKFPNVNLGYVKRGDLVKKIDDVEVYGFEKFTEKPDLETAKKFLKSYKYLWNTGIYVWKVATIMEAYKKHLPDTYERLMKIQTAWGTPDQEKTLAAEYPACQKISIDYGIMEKVDPKIVRIIPADLGWSDIGTWESLHEELTSDPSDNLTQGEVFALDTTGSILFNTEPKKLVVTAGLKNIVVIKTPDALLICDKSQSQGVKKVVEAIKENKRDDLL